jgi:hypothetical protein
MLFERVARAPARDGTRKMCLLRVPKVTIVVFFLRHKFVYQSSGLTVTSSAKISVADFPPK